MLFPIVNNMLDMLQHVVDHELTWRAENIVLEELGHGD